MSLALIFLSVFLSTVTLQASASGPWIIISISSSKSPSEVPGTQHKRLLSDQNFDQTQFNGVGCISTCTLCASKRQREKFQTVENTARSPSSRDSVETDNVSMMLKSTNKSSKDCFKFIRCCLFQKNSDEKICRWQHLFDSEGDCFENFEANWTDLSEIFQKRSMIYLVSTLPLPHTARVLHCSGNTSVLTWAIHARIDCCCSVRL